MLIGRSPETHRYSNNGAYFDIVAMVHHLATDRRTRT
jgi:hypothetical protein